MNDRFYLAILAGGALSLSGLVGCDAGDDPGAPDPDSTAMYEEEPRTETETETYGGTELDQDTETMGQTQTTDPARGESMRGGA